MTLYRTPKSFSLPLGLFVVSICVSTGTSAADARSASKAPAGAVSQGRAPLQSMDVYMAGFHVIKDDASQQMETHHYCREVSRDFAQCVLFDGNSATANLVGVEYIISEDVYESLPEEEQRYWHPHNYEILSGQLIMPDLPETLEEEALKTKLNTYGKTWRIWNAAPFAAPGDKLPLGEPVLGWSFNRDGEAVTELVKTRDTRLRVSGAAKRLSRRELVPLARPQVGVDELEQAFPRPTQAIPGVMEKREAGDKTR